ncbi:hypothetical protein H0H92_003160 [Tricholoma furcatifolium]|nr:hypothetical protein H0H92_003160 [Tricholoma furcatifolium]
MPPRKQPTRDQQLFTGGLGIAFTSPIRRSNLKHPNPTVAPLGNEQKRQQLLQQIAALQAQSLVGPLSVEVPTGSIPTVERPSPKPPEPSTPDVSYDAADTPFSVFPEFDAPSPTR